MPNALSGHLPKMLHEFLSGDVLFGISPICEDKSGITVSIARRVRIVVV